MRGRVPRANNLNISLLQRLENLYISQGNQKIIARLTQSDRCHPVILGFVSKLFYNSSLKCNKESVPATHCKHTYPLVFICSGADETTVTGLQDMEADIIVDKVVELTKRPPTSWNSSKPMKNYLITSPCANQVRKC